MSNSPLSSILASLSLDIPGFKGEIQNDSTVREEHSKDASVFKILPASVLYPKDTEDVQAVVRYVLMNKEINGKDESNPLTISVRAGGTCMSGGSLCEGYILNLTRHMHKINIDPEARTATVSMGAYFRDIEKVAKEHGLMFAPYTSSRLICGIGGMIGNNASGEKSVRHGATIDNVISVEVVCADGSVITTGPKSLQGTEMSRTEKELAELSKKYGQKLRTAIGDVPKAASGYRLERILGDQNICDITPIFIGAQGTLGIVTKAVLKLVPIPKYTSMLLISINDLASMPQVLKTIMSCNPEGVETFDKNTFERAKIHMRDHAKRIEPYFSDDTHVLIIAQFSEDTEEATKNKAKECEGLLSGFSVHFVLDNEKNVADSAWEIRRHSFTLMKDYNEPGFRAVPCIEDVIVPIANFDKFVTSLIQILKKHNVHYGFHGHIGDGSLRIIPIFDFTESADVVSKKIIALTREVCTLIKSLRGNISADHSDGIIRTPFLEEFYGSELYDAFVQVKKICDPLGIFNPGKKVGGTEEKIRTSLDCD